MKIITIILASIILIICGCSDADIASQRLSKAADMFEIRRRIVFYNGITGDYILTIEGLCSLGNTDPANKLSVTCKTGEGSFKKHFLGLSDNVTYFAEQMEPSKQSVYQYRIIFKPSVIIPDITASQSAEMDDSGVESVSALQVKTEDSNVNWSFSNEQIEDPDGSAAPPAN